MCHLSMRCWAEISCPSTQIRSITRPVFHPNDNPFSTPPPATQISEALRYEPQSEPLATAKQVASPCRVGHPTEPHVNTSASTPLRIRKRDWSGIPAAARPLVCHDGGGKRKPTTSSEMTLDWACCPVFLGGGGAPRSTSMDGPFPSDNLAPPSEISRGGLVCTRVRVRWWSLPLAWQSAHRGRRAAMCVPWAHAQIAGWRRAMASYCRGNGT